MVWYGWSQWLAKSAFRTSVYVLPNDISHVRRVCYIYGAYFHSCLAELSDMPTFDGKRQGTFGKVTTSPFSSFTPVWCTRRSNSRIYTFCQMELSTVNKRGVVVIEMNVPEAWSSILILKMSRHSRGNCFELREENFQIFAFLGLKV